MKNTILSALCTAVLFTTALTAQAYDPYDLNRLDVLKTCKLGTKQEVSAELALSFTKAIFSWHVGDQVSMLHPEFIAWHSAMTELLVTFPSLNAKVPFKNGQYTKQSMVATMATVAYSNDSEAYQGILKRVDCVGDDKVVLVGDFKSVQIQRDATTGCVQYRAPYTSSLKLIVDLKDLDVNGELKTFVYRFDTIIDENSTVKARADIANQVATQKPLPPEPGSCKTQKMIFDEFQSQVGI